MSWCPFGATSSAIIMHDPSKPVQEYHNVMQPLLKICVILVLMQINISWQHISLAVLPLYTLFKYYTLFGLFCTFILYYTFLVEKAWNTFLYFIERILLVFFRMMIAVHTECYWTARLKNETILSIYWWDPLAHWHSEWNWNHHQIVSKVYTVIWNKVTLGEYL